MNDDIPKLKDKPIIKRLGFYKKKKRLNEFESHIAKGVLDTGVTLIEENEAHFPLYLALRISSGRSALEAIQVKEAQVGYCSKGGLTEDNKAFAKRFEKQKESPTIENIEISEEGFWTAPDKLLSEIGMLTCVFVEVTDAAAFDRQKESVSVLHSAAKAKGVAIVLVCSWKLKKESGFPQISISRSEKDWVLTLKDKDGKPLNLPFSYVKGALDYRFEKYKGMTGQESTIRFYEHFGYSIKEVLKKLNIPWTTYVRLKDKLDQRSLAA